MIFRISYTIFRLSTIILIYFCFFSCTGSNEQSTRQVRPGKDEMADLNRYLVQKDRERIQNYIERKNLNMNESPTGMWYHIEKQGDGELLKDYDRIVMEYDCSLLDGTECYSSVDHGPKEIILGKSKIEPGLAEGLRMLKTGAEATFILPPFLAYGLVGDGEKIPPRAIIIYSVSILPSN